MTTPEQKIEKHLKKEVEASGGKVRKMKWIGKNGAPDRLVWWPRKPQDPHAYAFIELKAPGKKLSKLQEIEHEVLREDGWTVLVADSIEAVDAAILLVRDGVTVQPKVIKSAVRKPSTDHIDVRSPPNLPQTDNTDLT